MISGHPGARLKTVHDAGCRLCCMRPAISFQAPDTEVRVFVHKTSVFSAHREVSCQVVIRAAAIEEGAFPLSKQLRARILHCCRSDERSGRRLHRARTDGT